MRKREMRIDKPWWITVQNVRGFEDPTPPVDPPTPPAGDPAPGTSDPAGPPAGEPQDDTAGLKSALQKERDNNKAMAKQLKAYEKAQQEKDDADKSEVQRLTDANSKSSEKVTKLAAAFKSSVVERAILKAARAENFTDPTDALRDEVRSAIGVEQDEDDPSQVTVDADSVSKAVKELAKAKPHYLASQKPTPPAKGSKFGGTAQPTKQTEKERLEGLYSSLTNR